MNQFSFRVPLRFDPPTKPGGDPVPTAWMDPAGNEAGYDDAAVFTFKLHTTMAEDLRIEMAQDDIMGVGGTVDLQRAVTDTYGGLLELMVEDLWPAGEDGKSTRPPANSTAVSEAQEKRINEYYSSLLTTEAEHTDTRGLAMRKSAQAVERMAQLQSEFRLAASWGVLGIELPEGWSNLADKPLSARLKSAVTTAYTRARAEALEASGK